MIRQLWRRMTGGPRGTVGRAVHLQRSRRFSAPVPATTSDILAEYDAAVTNHHNSRHWANADNLSADEANSPTVRDALRRRARYECQENNSYGKGIVLTLANHTIGTGPRLQVLTSSRANNQRIEAAWSMWARRINLAAKLRTMRVAKAVDGEAFALLVTNRALQGVQLDIRLVEADQVCSPLATIGPNQVDGVRFDENGIPVSYDILRYHPGGAYFGSGLDVASVPARLVIHMFRVDRPGQHRGVPEVTAALPLFAQLRRFTLATIAAAETAADFAGVMYTDAPAIADPDDVEAMDAVELERNAMLTLPRGWKMGQMRAEHPTTTYEMFRNAILNEIARCVHMPANVARGDSSGYNFASGKLDHQTYFASIDVERSEWETQCLDRLLSEWFDEAALLGLLPADLGPMDELPHRWHWPAVVSGDPAKEASAQAQRLKSGTTSYASEFAAVGRDWEEEQESQAGALGLTLDEYRSRLVAALFGIAAEPETEEEDADEQTA